MTSPSDLTSLADCKAWLGLTSGTDDSVIGDLVGAVSRAILADLGRPAFLPAIYTETFDGAGESRIALCRWPVTALLSCVIDGVSAPIPPWGRQGVSVEAGEPAPPGAMQCLVFRGDRSPHGVGNVAVTYRAGYEIMAEPAVVPSSAPFSVAVQAPFGAWRVDTGVAGAAGAYVASDGVYTFAAADAGAAVALSYGYVPADLAQAAKEWVADRYAARTRIGHSAKTLGGQETTSFIVKAMPDVVARLLQPYRRVAR